MTMNLKTLCASYAPYSHQERLEKLFDEFDRVLITSSFGTTSAILLDLLQKVRPEQPIYFIDTGYMFPETHRYRQTLTQKWGLEVYAVRPKANENNFTKLNYTWTHDADMCCFVNKVMPAEELKKSHDVWVSGMIQGHTENRRNMPLFKEDRDIVRFYPLADMTPQEARWYYYLNELPEHPLKEKGYDSVGCQHCTLPGNGRDGRWTGSLKTECGLHKIA